MLLLSSHSKMKFSYSFNLSSTAPAVREETLYPYDYNEFVLSLPEDWKQIPTAEERTLTWQSDKEKAGITVSADFYKVPESKWATLAEVNLDSRQQAFASVSDESVTVVSRTVKPYSGGGGLELSFVAHASGVTYMYLGYVTSRKVFNFTLTSGADKRAAIDLYNKTMQARLRVKIP